MTPVRSPRGAPFETGVYADTSPSLHLLMIGVELATGSFPSLRMSTPSSPPPAIGAPREVPGANTHPPLRSLDIQTTAEQLCNLDMSRGLLWWHAAGDVLPLQVVNLKPSVPLISVISPQSQAPSGVSTPKRATPGDGTTPDAPLRESCSSSVASSTRGIEGLRQPVVPILAGLHCGLQIGVADGHYGCCSSTPGWVTILGGAPVDRQVVVAVGVGVALVVYKLLLLLSMGVMLTDHDLNSPFDNEILVLFWWLGHPEVRLMEYVMMT
ncbi:hypothetical protein BDK51DRAFT_48022 [Blyttiomyces helicus]|uniref:Uncharacterized protein n=1 Tax=Blyttiomyces helicus TaxID=388810 RepID=A0A4P9WJR2_9FUNG|nr:hypothetical protein BDK51DRAFT_48022 [Blyttiomyces helicus]|eukprot:RKO91380.1 hypothetical protein BDK51DRAFT_48022 [Blyttiomyces helicus]